MICEDCGRVFNEDELETTYENVGEFWGTPAYESYVTCPYCKSTYVSESRCCEECGTEDIADNIIKCFDDIYRCKDCCFKCNICGEFVSNSENKGDNICDYCRNFDFDKE